MRFEISVTPSKMSIPRSTELAAKKAVDPASQVACIVVLDVLDRVVVVVQERWQVGWPECVGLQFDRFATWRL
jgi:hypothetical protein